MYTVLILATIVGFLLMFAVCDFKDSNFLEYAIAYAAGFILGGLFGALLSLMMPKEYETVYKTEKIVCIQDNSSLKGAMFLGCGNINGQMSYSYYTNCRGVYKLHQVDAESTSIVYSTKEPKIITCTEVIKKSNWHFFEGMALLSTYVIQVPKGSISNDFSLDAK